jgi:nucleoside-diphosphate-sugar epimerase
MRIVVTGGSGKGGRWVVRDLREHGHDVLNVDLRHDGSPHGQCAIADLTDLGQAHDVLSGADAVVHFAAIPAPELRAEGETFRINALSTYNVFQAAVGHRMRRVVWASSETVLGLPFDRPPDFAPIDESITPRPETSYALSKLVGETMAAQFARRSGIGFVGLRISNIMEPGDYAAFPSYWDDAQLRRWNLWGYVDARDVATAARVPPGPAPPSGRGTRHAAGHRSRAPAARVRAGASLGRPRQRLTQWATGRSSDATARTSRGDRTQPRPRRPG